MVICKIYRSSRRKGLVGLSKDRTERKTVADFPELVKEWHPTKNDDLQLKEITAGSGKKIWWKCKKESDHEWEARPADRTHKHSGCPYCRGLQASITNSLATRFPDIAKEWHPTKNGELTPDKIVAGSNKKVWWKCTKGPDHEWEATLSDRTLKQSKCPLCAGRKVSVTNSLANLYPEIAKEWHPTTNGKLKPQDIVSGTHKKVWWKCLKGPDHEWEAQVKSRTQRGDGCPFCDGKKVSVTNSLTTFLSVALILVSQTLSYISSPLLLNNNPMHILDILGLYNLDTLLLDLSNSYKSTLPLSDL